MNTSILLLSAILGLTCAYTNVGNSARTNGYVAPASQNVYSNPSAHASKFTSNGVRQPVRLSGRVGTYQKPASPSRYLADVNRIGSAAYSAPSTNARHVSVVRPSAPVNYNTTNRVSAPTSYNTVGRSPVSAVKFGHNGVQANAYNTAKSQRAPVYSGTPTHFGNQVHVNRAPATNVYNTAASNRAPVYNTAASNRAPVYNTAASNRAPVYNTAAINRAPVYNTAAINRAPVYNTAAINRAPAYNTVSASSRVGGQYAPAGNTYNTVGSPVSNQPIAIWGEWGACSRSCGANSEQRRYKTCVSSTGVAVDVSFCGGEQYRRRRCQNIACPAFNQFRSNQGGRFPSANGFDRRFGRDDFHIGNGFTGNRANVNNNAY